MAITKSELRNIIKRRLGAPMVKIELTDQQIDDNIDYARDTFIKYAIGNAVQEEYITMMLSGGVATYDLPSNVREVVNYTDGSGGGSLGGSINTLFTIENYFYSQGMLANLRDPFNLIGYHIALDFIETLGRYVHSTYQWKYNRFNNQLTLSPTPPTTATGGSLLSVTSTAGDTTYYDSPGYALLRVYSVQADDDDIYNELWVRDYTFALCLRTLGYIRRKFASFGSIGNQGISLDGDSLVGEAETMLERLEEKLKDDESHEGWGLEMG